MRKKEVIIGLVSAIFMAGLISIFASSAPDGLERIAENMGFIEKTIEPAVKSPIPDYVIPGFTNKKLATSISGIIGTLFVFGLGYGLAAIIKHRKS